MPICNQCRGSATPAILYNRVNPPSKWEKFWSNFCGNHWIYRCTKCDRCNTKIGFWKEVSKKKYKTPIPDDRRVQH